MLNDSPILSERPQFHPPMTTATPLAQGFVRKPAAGTELAATRRVPLKRLSCKTCLGKCCVGRCRF